LTSEAVRRYVSPALECGDLLFISDDLFLSREAFLAATSAITTRLQVGQQIKTSELRSQTALSPDVFDYVINALVREQKVQPCNEMVSINNAGGKSSNAETEQLAAVAQAYGAAGLAAPSVVELAQKLNLKEPEMRSLVTLLQRNKTIVRMGSDNLFIHFEALNQLVAKLTPIRGSLIDVASFKQLTGLSRKYAIPLLEYLDRLRITRIQGDQRLVL
jgi:selenocysteine-specific elongation factor